MEVMRLPDVLRDVSRRTPDKVALAFGAVEPHEEITYAELERRVDAVAAGLVRVGVRPGERVAIAMNNVPHFVFAYLGVLRAGAVAVPLNVMLVQAEVAAILSDSEPSALLYAPGPGDAAAAAASSVGVEHVFSTDDWSSLEDQGSEPVTVEVEGEDLAVLSYTSGTTGAPKGAMLTHANLEANLEQQMSIPEATVTADDVVLLVLPLFHIFGLNVSLGLTILNGATGILLERFEPIPGLRTLQQAGVTVVFGAPPMYVAWTETPGADQYDVSSVRLAVSGAAALPERVLRSFRDTFGVPIYEGYGLTESAPTVTSNRMGRRPRVGSVGRPLPGVEVRVLGPTGDEVEPGDPGEIVVRGPNVFAGYWRRPEETAAVLRDGWLYTGDIAVRDEDGYIYLVDRKRDLIIVSGFNVFPSEVENALVANPKVKEAAVVGVPHPYTGEAVKAFVVLNDGASATDEELVSDAGTRLARFKCPSSVEIVESLPHLLSGKVMRRVLRSQPDQEPASPV